MIPVPKTIPVSDLRNKYLEVIAGIQDDPAVVIQRSEPVAVLISPATWNSLLEQLEDQRDTIAGLDALLRLERGEGTTSELTAEQLTEWAARDAVAN